jgi:LysM repeat protein
MCFRRSITICFLFLNMSAVGVWTATGQTQSDSSCPALLELALSQIGNNCANLPRNSACYGFNSVNATFAQAVSQGFFARPADLSELASLKTIETTPLDLGLGQWGIAVMNVQANVPNTLPGQAVTFVLMGDTQVENAVTTDSPPVTVITQAVTELHEQPDPQSPLMGSVAGGTVLEAVGLSPNGVFVRVRSNAGEGWVTLNTLNPTSQLASLPVLDKNPPAPMQSFYFRTGVGAPDCTQTPSVLAIRSPENITVDLTANGANIRLSSLVTLQILPDGETMQITTLEGNAILEPGTDNEVQVPAGFSSTRCLAAPENLGNDGEANDQVVGPDCPWQPPRPTTLLELEEFQTVQAAYDRLNLTDVVTEQTPPVSPPLSTPPPPSPVANECPAGTTITHVVAPGENLFRIGLRYQTGVGAIMQANNITNPQRIFVGQQLIIPCGVDTGIPSIPPTSVSPLTPFPITPITGVDCSRFRATSPLDGLNYGSNTFYWDPAPGATQYRVNIYSIDEKKGALVGSFLTKGSETNLTVDLTIQTVGYGFSFAWEVQAILDGQVACTSQRFTVPRAPGGQPASGSSSGSGFSANWGCTGLYTFDVNYAGLPPGTTTLTVSFTFTGGTPSPVPPFTFTPSGDPGSQGFSGFGPISVASGSVTANPSGTTIGIAPATISC